VTSVSATLTIPVPIDAVFDVIADPTTHVAIDGTGWVREEVDVAPITELGQVFRMGMFHPQHPDGDYEIHNLVVALDRPRVIGWKPGYVADDGNLAFGGWVWRYDLTAVDDGTEVTLTYDWSGVPPEGHEVLTFPPFPPDHLSSSLVHLAELAQS
jgi:hypothetical protein